MVGLLNAITLGEKLVPDLIEVLDTRGKPWHLGRANLCHAVSKLVEL